MDRLSVTVYQQIKSGCNESSGTENWQKIHWQILWSFESLLWPGLWWCTITLKYGCKGTSSSVDIKKVIMTLWCTIICFGIYLYSAGTWFACGYEHSNLFYSTGPYGKPCQPKLIQLKVGGGIQKGKKMKVNGLGRQKLIQGHNFWQWWSMHGYILIY